MRFPLRQALFAAVAMTLAAPAMAQDKLPAEVIHWWTSGGESAAVQVFADQYNKAGGEWIDNAIAIGENARAAAINRVIGGDPPTAMQFNTGKQFDDLVSQGLVNDIEEVASADGWRDFLPPAFVEAATRDGKFYAVPVNVHGQNWIWYSTEVMEKSGVDMTQVKTADELIAALDKVEAAGFVPLALGGQAWQERLMFRNLLLSVGGEDLYMQVMRDKSEEAMRSDAFRQVVDTFGKLRAYVDEGSPGRNWNDATAMLISNQAGIQFMGDWAKGEFIAAGKAPGEDYGCIVGLNGTDFIIGGDVFVFAKTDDPKQIEAQHLLARTMISPETQVLFNQKKGSVPVRTDVDVSELDACAQHGLELMANVDNQVPVDDMLLTADLIGALNDVVTNFWHDPSATTDSFIDNWVSAFQSAG